MLPIAGVNILRTHKEAPGFLRGLLEFKGLFCC